MANPNPPKEHQWKPGESGNPNGRPPKGHSITEMMQEMLGNKPEVKRALGQRIIKLAIEEGDMAAIKLLWQYMDGMPSQPIEHSGEITGVQLYKPEKENGNQEVEASQGD